MEKITIGVVNIDSIDHVGILVKEIDKLIVLSSEDAKNMAISLIQSADMLDGGDEILNA